MKNAPALGSDTKLYSFAIALSQLLNLTGIEGTTAVSDTIQCVGHT